MRRPDSRNSAHHTIETSSVWPTSGCSTSSASSGSNNSTAIGNAGMSARRSLSANAQAASTTKAGFASSEGCIEKPAMRNQRRAPLISSPPTSTATIAASAAR